MKKHRSICLAVFLIAAIFVRAQEQPAPNYEAMARLIIAELAERQFDKVVAQYDERLAAALPLDKLTAAWNSIIAQVGAFQSITAVEQEERFGYHIVYATCSFAKDKTILALAFDAKGKFGSFSMAPLSSRMPWTAPDYAKPEKFEERNVTVRTGSWELPGTLTLPKGAGPFPAVVLVHGSGPNDQDETVGGSKTFKDLAWGLASRGVAVLRYTKRTRKYGARSGEDLNAFTAKEETIDDARTAVALLAGMPEINPKQIFIAGHSLGAYLGPRIASGDAQVAGLILMAGNTRPLEDLVVEQVRYEARLKGEVTPEAQKQIDAAEASAKEFRNPDLKPGMAVDLLGSKLPASYVLDLRNYHPAETAATLKIPIYILQGGRDYQVRPADFEGWRKALGLKLTVRLKLYPELNHLFVAGNGMSTPAEYSKPGHVAEEVVIDVANWIAAQSTTH
jgi:dienelactone hydrolase